MTKVFLSAGHGGSDPGAVAYGLKEKEINLQTLLACNEVLVAHGVQTACSRTKDENDPVAEEVREANECGATLAVSFHANAGGGDGFEAYYYESDTNGKKLAALGEKYVKALGQNSRGLKTKDLAFIRETKMTAVLFESFFVDNDTDNDIGDTVAEQRAFGVAYAKAILEYLGIAYKAQGNATNTPQKPSESPAGGYAGNSIVDYLNSIGKPSDFNSRAGYAKQYGISSYTGTASQNTALLNAMRGNSSNAGKPSVSYYKAFNSTSIVDGLKSIGVDSSFENRKKIAQANAISNYSGTASQNNTLCNLAKKGKLKK